MKGDRPRPSQITSRRSDAKQVQEELDAMQPVERHLPHQGVDLAGGSYPGVTLKDDDTTSGYDEFGLIRWTRSAPH